MPRSSRSTSSAAPADSSSAPALGSSELASMRRRLLHWYDREQRRLPWRERPSPYGTVVSEFMLQQTQVATVLPYYESFLSRFPDFAALASATEESVLAAWSGLGYYRRARSLKRVAEEVVRRHAGALPRDLDALRALPGVGGYTAAAVGSIALGLRVAAVDGNVRRVIARLFALSGAGIDARIESLAGELLAPRRPGDWNQAMMELGATVCVPRAPRCLLCPLHADCRARGQGDPERYPAAKRLPAVRSVLEIAVALMKQGRVLVLQRGEEGAFAGMWELPRLDTREVDAAELTPERVLFETVRLHGASFETLGEAEAAFTHHRIRMRLVGAGAAGAGAVRRQRHVAHRWVAVGDLGALAASKAQRRLFALLAESAAGAER